MEHKKTSSASTDCKRSVDTHRESLPHFQASSCKDRSSIRRQICRELRSRWNRLSLSTRRLVTCCVLPLTVCFLVADVIDTVFPIYGVQQPVLNVNQPSLTFEVSKTKEFAVVINTYQRPKQLLDSVRHYAETCGPSIGIETIYVLWAEEAVSPPTTELFFRGQETQRRSIVKVIPISNSLNSRFLPIPDVNDMAVFMVDDDVRVDCRSLKRGFDAWKSNPMSMVGYYPRLSLLDHSEKGILSRAPLASFVEYTWPYVFWRQELNVVLTKAAFLHSQYMNIYSDPNQHPIEILNYIDQYLNCEDFAMSLLVANVTKLSSHQLPARPIYVEGSVRDTGLFNGISTASGFTKRRSKCLRDITAMYKDHGWEIPLDQTFSLQRSSWRQHRFWWQSRPSNIFEWLALANLFQ